MCADLDLGESKKLVSHAGIIFVVNLRQKHNERLVNLVFPPPPPSLLETRRSRTLL